MGGKSKGGGGNEIQFGWKIHTSAKENTNRSKILIIVFNNPIMNVYCSFNASIGQFKML